ncbi:MAG: hypothetical protein QM784_39355 [Polyangiaceae bacterium]
MILVDFRMVAAPSISGACAHGYVTRCSSFLFPSTARLRYFALAPLAYILRNPKPGSEKAVLTGRAQLEEGPISL